MFSRVKREVRHTGTASQAYEDALAVAGRVGKVKKADPDTHTIKARAWFGSAGVWVTIKIEDHPSGALITMSASGEDIWGYGAGKVLEKLQMELQAAAGAEVTADTPARPSRMHDMVSGDSPDYLGFILTVVVLVVPLLIVLVGAVLFERGIEPWGRSPFAGGIVVGVGVVLAIAGRVWLRLRRKK